MPFYTYKCPLCDAEVEEMREMDDRRTNPPMCYNAETPIRMELVTNPVAGIVKNPAVPRRSK